MNKLNRDFFSFFISLLPRIKQVRYAVNFMYKKDVLKIMKEESEVVGKEPSKLASLYWEAMSETILILEILKDQQKLDEAFLLIDDISSDRSFNVHLFKIADFIHQNHPFYIKQTIELFMIRNNINELNNH